MGKDGDGEHALRSTVAHPVAHEGVVRNGRKTLSEALRYFGGTGVYLFLCSTGEEVPLWEEPAQYMEHIVAPTLKRRVHTCLRPSPGQAFTLGTPYSAAGALSTLFLAVTLI